MRIVQTGIIYSIFHYPLFECNLHKCEVAMEMNWHSAKCKLVAISRVSIHIVQANFSNKLTDIPRPNFQCLLYNHKPRNYYEHWNVFLNTLKTPILNSWRETVHKTYTVLWDHVHYTDTLMFKPLNIWTLWKRKSMQEKIWFLYSGKPFKNFADVLHFFFFFCHRMQQVGH